MLKVVHHLIFLYLSIGFYLSIGSPESRVFILVALARVNASNWFKPIARVYTRECHENKNTRFWATCDKCNLS